MNCIQMMSVPILAVLAGCGNLQPYLQQGVETVREAKDTEALGVLAGVCITGMGSAGRVLTVDQAYHVVALCWGEEKAQAVLKRFESPPTVIDLQKAVTTIQSLNGGK